MKDNKDIKIMNDVLTQISKLQTLGDDVSARALADELICDESFLAIIKRSNKKIERQYGFENENDVEAIISCVYCWLLDGTLQLANSDNYLNFISNRISYNGRRAGSKEVAREYGLHDVWVQGKHISFGAIDGAIGDLSDIHISNIDVFHEIALSNNRNKVLDIIVKTIDSTVCDYLLKNDIEIADFIEYCTDWRYDQTVKSKDYGSASDVWNWLSQGNVRASLNNRLNREFNKVEKMGIDCSAVREALNDWKRTRTIITLSVAMADQDL